MVSTPLIKNKNCDKYPCNTNDMVVYFNFPLQANAHINISEIDVCVYKVGTKVTNIMFITVDDKITTYCFQLNLNFPLLAHENKKKVKKLLMNISTYSKTTYLFIISPSLITVGLVIVCKSNSGNANFNT